MNALEFLISLRPAIPMAMNGNKPIIASNGDLRRWLENKAVIINGKKPGPKDENEFPIDNVVFFPKSPERKTTIW